MRYAVVIEKAGKNYGAYVPDLPGCIATGESVAEVETLIAQAMALHLEGMREDGITPPTPSVITKMVEAA
jgi:predicted RNase H-like HicB family nuclease